MGAMQQMLLAGKITLNVTLSNTSFVGSGTTSTITSSASSTATPSNGTGPYTYQWVQLTDTGGVPWGFSAGATATTFARMVGTISGDIGSGTCACNVTDSLGNKGTSNAASVSLTHT